jgi:signal transduction histidine kinase
MNVAALAPKTSVHTVLIVDDTPANLHLVVECLEDQGHRVVIAQDGEEGLQRAMLVQPDLILLDVMLPGLDGFEICRRLKAGPSTCDIPVIFMTSLADTGDKVAAFKAGGLDYVTKPVQIDEVMARINAHLSLHVMREQLAAQNVQLQREIVERQQAEEALQEMILSVRNVSNAIAHDLRTPLAELRSSLEELSVTRPSPEATFNGIEGAVADVDRVIAIFDALLRLAEIDTGARRSGFRALDVARIASEAAEFYHPVAEMKGLALAFEASGELKLSGDPLLLAQAVGNLIENALKYAQKNGAIQVAAARRPDGCIEIAVSDDGPGIPDEEKPKVTERFYRGDASRGTPGVGLGLSLVAAVAKLHGGLLELTDNRPGLRANLVLAGAFTPLRL